MPVFAVTGNLCSGKSKVTSRLKKKGAVIFDADGQVHKYYKNRNSAVFKKVAAAFPSAVVGGKISCKELGEIVFSNRNKLKQLQRLVHPQAIKDLNKWIKAAKKRKRVYVAEVPLLFEARLQSLFDGLILVSSKEKVLIPRIVKSFSITRNEAKKRLALFLPVKKKAKKADFIINNNSSLKALNKSIDILWEFLKEFKK